MNPAHIFESRRLALRTMAPEDVTDEYVGWLNDPEVNRFLEVRFTSHTPEEVKKFISQKANDARCIHLGVFEKGSERVIGTVTFNDINRHHLSASISFVIGGRGAGGKGYGTEAVHAATRYLFSKLGFFKIWGGYYDGHAGSARVFEKNGYSVEGRLRKKLLNFRNERVDHIYVGLLSEDFVPKPEFLGGAQGK